MLLKCREIIKGIDTSQVAGMDQANEQISNARTIFSFIKRYITDFTLIPQASKW